MRAQGPGWVIERLAAAGCVAAEAEAADMALAAPGGAVPAAWVGRRERGEPLGWITGTCRFAGRGVRVAPGVYEPRPQTEALARRAAAVLPAGGRALDLCTGSGAVAAHLRAAVPSAVVLGVDLDLAAAVCARSNGVPTVVGDLDAALRHDLVFDVVTAVAPYVPRGEMASLPADVQRWEPRSALDGGADGLDVVERVVSAARRRLRPGGWVLVELGADQDRGLAPHLAATGLTAVETWADDDGDLRGLAARRPP